MPKLVRSQELSILDFDIENRPLSYLGMDFTTSEITAIAASFEGSRNVHTFLLGELTQEEILSEFLELYRAADIVTGHYILHHDLPIISGALAEFEMEKLPPRLTSDTKVHLKTAKGISKSQENLSAMLGIKAPKVQMNQVLWREANRLTPEGIRLTRQRVEGDIKQHKQLRRRLVELDLLGPPVLWKP